MTIVKRIIVNRGREIRIFKVWHNSAWMFMVKKYTLVLFMLSVAGWSEESGLRTSIEYFPSLEEAEKHALEIKNNYLGK